MASHGFWDPLEDERSRGPPWNADDSGSGLFHQSGRANSVHQAPSGPRLGSGNAFPEQLSPFPGAVFDAAHCPPGRITPIEIMDAFGIADALPSPSSPQPRGTRPSPSAASGALRADPPRASAQDRPRLAGIHEDFNDTPLASPLRLGGAGTPSTTVPRRWPPATPKQKEVKSVWAPSTNEGPVCITLSNVPTDDRVLASLRHSAELNLHLHEAPQRASSKVCLRSTVRAPSIRAACAAPRPCPGCGRNPSSRLVQGCVAASLHDPHPSVPYGAPSPLPVPRLRRPAGDCARSSVASACE